ncbi:MAG: hypothetical protein AAF311_03245 [Pseudomonadota bacterium]
MSFRTTILAALLPLLAACSTSGSLYPVAGGFYEASQIAPIEVTLSGAVRNSGTMSVTLPDGEALEGPWSLVGKANSVASWGTLMAQYDNSAAELAANPEAYRGKAYLVGDRGTTMDVEYALVGSSGKGLGIARDSRNNIYRVVF